MLETGAVIFYERFQGVDGPKDRYFIVIRNCGPLVECFTTTTQPHAEKSPRLATEFCEIDAGESCLPKRCFVDLSEASRNSETSKLEAGLDPRALKSVARFRGRFSGDSEMPYTARVVYPSMRRNHCWLLSMK